jgi:hypothetical protein
MTERELESRGFHFERYGRGTDDGAGCIVAFYKGNDARYAGQSFGWSRQPLVQDPFPSKAAAVEAAAKVQEPL